MREILFRGKMPVESKWAYGSLISEANIFDKMLVLTHIYDKDCNEILVDPKTVGQYTGLCDKNGTKIFEGDILKISFGKGFLKAVVKFGYYNQTDKILKSHLGFYFDFVDSESYRKDVGFWTGKTFSKIEIIGNIHDNPELLKGSAKNE